MGDDDDSDSESDEEVGNAAERGITSKDLEKRVEAQRTAERNLIKVVKAFRHMPTMRMTTGQRRFLFFWHLAVILASVALVALGTFLTYWFDEYLSNRVDTITKKGFYARFVRLKQKPKISNFYGAIVTEHGNGLIGLGLTYLFVTFFYISFFGHRFQFTWPSLVLINIIALVLELSNLLVRLSPIAQLSSTQRTHLQTVMKTNYKIKSTDAFSVAYDYLSIWGECCGVTSMYDFQGAKYIYEEIKQKERLEYTLQAPAVCCKRELFWKNSERVRDCAKDLQNTYETGCFNILFDLIQSYQVVYIFVIGFYIMDLVIHISIYRDMLTRLEPELGIDLLNRLEAIRQLESDRNAYRGERQDNYLVTSDQTRQE